MNLSDTVFSVADENPKQSTLFRDISSYILKNTTQTTLINGEPSSKKRKLDEPNGTQNGKAGDGSLTNVAVAAWRTYPGTSFSIPQRKKLTLELVLGKGGDGGIRALGAGNTVEFSIGWKDVGKCTQPIDFWLRVQLILVNYFLTKSCRPNILPPNPRESQTPAQLRRYTGPRRWYPPSTGWHTRAYSLDI